MSTIPQALAITANDIGNAITIAVTPFTLGGLITLIMSWVVYLVGVLAFFFLIYSGILYITAGGNPEQAKKAQQGLINAIIGIIIVTLSFVILRVASNLAAGGSII